MKEIVTEWLEKYEYSKYYIPSHNLGEIQVRMKHLEEHLGGFVIKKMTKLLCLC